MWVFWEEQVITKTVMALAGVARLLRSTLPIPAPTNTCEGAGGGRVEAGCLGSDYLTLLAVYYELPGYQPPTLLSLSCLSQQPARGGVENQERERREEGLWWYWWRLDSRNNVKECRA